MFEEIVRIRGVEDGPTSMILGGVHGNETCGVKVIRKILPTLNVEKGILLIGYGNPRAIRANQRFTEANLNRMFKNDDSLSPKEKQSYEYARAQFLKTYLDQADALLDIHASFTPNAPPFLICENNARGIADYVPVDLVVSGFDAVEPGGTDYYMNATGKIGICVECGHLDDPTTNEIAEKSFFAFLKARGHLPNDLSNTKQSYMRMYDLYLTKTDLFTLAKPFEDFEAVMRDQLIGTDGTKEVRAIKDSVILFARNRQQAHDEAFLLGEKTNGLA